MDDGQARKWIIKTSLIAVGLLIVFFFIAPSIGYPLRYEQSFNLLGMVAPVFSGYLGAASQFLTKDKTTNRVTNHNNEGVLELLVKGPIIIYSGAIMTILFSFYYSNRPEAEIGRGMTIEALGMGLSLAHVLLVGATSAIVSSLFQSKQERGNDQ